MKNNWLGIPLLVAALVACPQPQPQPSGTLSSIALTCTSSSIAIAVTSTCTAVGKDSSGANLATQPAFTFNSSDMGKAFILGGTVTGVAVGSSSVTASSGGVISNSVTITVTTSTQSGAIFSKITTGDYHPSFRS